MSHDPVPLKGIHHVEMWVGNAKQSAFYYRHAFGFTQTAYSGLETGNRDFASYVLEQGKMKLVLSTPINSTNGMSSHIVRHGDGVRDIAFHVDNADDCFHHCISKGAEPFMEPKGFSDDNGFVQKASIKAYGDTIHSFSEV